MKRAPIRPCPYPTVPLSDRAPIRPCPYPTVPYPGNSWEPQAHPRRPPHADLRLGTVTLLTRFRPAPGQVRVKGVIRCPTTVLHAWLNSELDALLATLPEPLPLPDPLAQRAQGTRWQQEGLRVTITWPAMLPPRRLLLVWDHRTGPHPPELVLWLFARGVLLRDTPLSGRRSPAPGSRWPNPSNASWGGGRWRGSTRRRLPN
jgi:hypothetical protein